MLDFIFKRVFFDELSAENQWSWFKEKLKDPDNNQITLSSEKNNENLIGL